MEDDTEVCNHETVLSGEPDTLERDDEEVGTTLVPLTGSTQRMTGLQLL